MTDTPAIVVTGASGRMGRMLIRTVLEADAARLSARVERPGNEWLGKGARPTDTVRKLLKKNEF